MSWRDHDRFAGRIQAAAVLLECRTDQEAVMVGAVVRTTIRLRYWNPWAALQEARDYGALMGVDMAAVDLDALRPIVARFNLALRFVDLR